MIKDSFVVDKSCNDALDHLNNATDTLSPFTTFSDVEAVASFRCVRKSLEEAISTVLERWGGHLVRDNWNIQIRQNIGRDRGVVLSYGKNIVNIKWQEVWDEVVTKLMPVGKDGLMLPETWLEAGETLYEIPYTKVLHFDQSEIEQENYKTEDGEPDIDAYNEALTNDLRQKGINHLNANVVPKVNYTLNAYMHDISDIGDTIYVKHPKCKIDLVTNVIALEYDVLLGRIVKVEFGNFRNTLKNLMNTMQSKITEEVDRSAEQTTAKLEKELNIATQKIKDTLGNSYVVHDGDKILILDRLPKEEAQNVIMINSAGIGFSQDGINGTFNSAWTIDSTLDMNNINTINLVADMIKGGTLKLGSNLNESGILELYSGSNKLICLLDKDGITIFCENGNYIKLNAEEGLAGYDSKGTKIYWVDSDEFHMKKSVVEEEITISSRLQFIPITTDTNTGIGVVAMV